MLLLLLCDECLLLMPVASTVELLLFILYSSTISQQKERSQGCQDRENDWLPHHGWSTSGFSILPQAPSSAFLREMSDFSRAIIGEAGICNLIDYCSIGHCFFVYKSSTLPMVHHHGPILLTNRKLATSHYRTFQTKSIVLSRSTCWAVMEDGRPSTSRLCCSRCTTTHCPK